MKKEEIKDKSKRFNEEADLALAENKRRFDEISNQIEEEWKDLLVSLREEEDNKKRMEILQKMSDNTDKLTNARKEWRQNVLDILGKHRRQMKNLLDEIDPRIYQIYSKIMRERA